LQKPTQTTKTATHRKVVLRLGILIPLPQKGSFTSGNYAKKEHQHNPTLILKGGRYKGKKRRGCTPEGINCGITAAGRDPLIREKSSGDHSLGGELLEGREGRRLRRSVAEREGQSLVDTGKSWFEGSSCPEKRDTEKCPSRRVKVLCSKGKIEKKGCT